MRDHAHNWISRWRTCLVLVASCLMLTAAPSSSFAAEGTSAAAWGENVKAELEAGYRDTYEDSPVGVAGLENISEVAVGSNFAVARLSNGTVLSWGNNPHGQLGDDKGGEHEGTWPHGLNYVTVNELSGVKQLAVANEHALALLENGTVEVWGGGDYGELGNGKGGTEYEEGGKPHIHRESSRVPIPVEGLSNVIAVAAGGGSDFALLSNHTVVAWGEDHAGQLGLAEAAPEKCFNEVKQELACSTRPLPVKTAGGGVLEHVQAISGGEEDAYAVLEDGHVMAWGANQLGQTGTGGEVLHVNTVPAEVKSASTGEALTGVAAVASGGYHTLALLESGEVMGWGGAGPDLGEMGTPEKCKQKSCIKTAKPIKGLEGIKASSIAASEKSSFALSGGKVYSFGKDEHGELGNGTTTDSAVPKVVEGIGAVRAIVASSTTGTGKSFVFALLQAGVAAPAPILSVEPKEGALKINWKLPAPEYEIQYFRRSSLPEECEAPEGGEEGAPPEEEESTGEGGETCSGEETEPGEVLGTFKLHNVQSYELTGLEPVQYAIFVKSHNGDHLEKKRIIFGTPLA
jgi:alpha-tubulin suppressor-like RCC1 family protein